MKHYAKAVAALLAGLATWGGTSSADGAYSQAELWGLVGVLATAWAVYAAPYIPHDEPVTNGPNPDVGLPDVT